MRRWNEKKKITVEKSLCDGGQHKKVISDINTRFRLTHWHSIYGSINYIIKFIIWVSSTVSVECRKKNYSETPFLREFFFYFQKVSCLQAERVIQSIADSPVELPYIYFYFTPQTCSTKNSWDRNAPKKFHLFLKKYIKVDVLHDN